MECPHCEYKDKWNAPGDEGDFYRLPVEVSRERQFQTERETLYACPKCGKTFIQV